MYNPKVKIHVELFFSNFHRQLLEKRLTSPAPTRDLFSKTIEKDWNTHYPEENSGTMDKAG